MFPVLLRTAEYSTIMKSGPVDIILKSWHLQIPGKKDDNIATIAESFEKLMRTDRKDFIDIEIACWVGHRVGPLWRFIEGYSLSTGPYNQYPKADGIHRINLEKVEWLVRCSLYSYLPKLKTAVGLILESINNDGVCEANIYDNEFKGWGPYGGLRLEADWRSKICRACDITFRALLIIHYCDL
jgi:hypothetical protein